MSRSEVEAIVDNYVVKRREQVYGLLNYLDPQGFFTAPASSKHAFHGCFEGGLASHSLDVADTLIKIPFGNSSAESRVIVGLFHDVHKVVDGFGNSYYVDNILKSGNRSGSQPYKRNENMVSMCGGYVSVLIVSKFVSLTADEMQAIAHHDGLYVKEGFSALVPVEKICPLTLILHFADMWCGIIKECPKSLLANEKNRTKYFCEFIGKD